MTEEQKRKQKKKLDAVSDPEEDQGDGNFYTHFRHNILTYGRVPPCKA